MARLWSTGFELGTLLVECAGAGDGGGTADTTVKRNGTYSHKITGLTTGTLRGVSHIFTAASADGPYYARLYFRLEVAPSAENRIIALRDFTAAVAYITVDSGRLLRLYDEDGAIGSASSALTLDTWYRIELTFDRTPAPGSEVVRAYIDGSEFAGSATRSLSAGVDRLTWGGNLASEAQTTGVWYFDDVAINDSTGTAQTGLPGAGGIRHVKPNGAGDAAATTGTFADIDEVTPDDATTKIEVDANGAANYAMESWATAGGDAGDTITLVQIGTRQTCDGAGTIGWTCQVKSQSAGTTQTGSAKTHDDTTWRTNGDADPRNYSLTSYVDPQGGGAWTPTLLDSMIAGVDVTDADPDAWFTTIWALVEFTPAAAASAIPVLMNLQRQYRS